MNKNNITIAKAYYTAMSKKDIAQLAQYLDADVQFKSPFAKSIGKEAFLQAAQKLIATFSTLTIRAVCSSDDQAMVAYDFEFPAPIGHVPTAAILDIKDGLITNIELFFDGRSFNMK